MDRVKTFELALRSYNWPTPIRRFAESCNDGTVRAMRETLIASGYNADIQVAMVDARITHIELTFNDNASYTAFMLRWG